MKKFVRIGHLCLKVSMIMAWAVIFATSAPLSAQEIMLNNVPYTIDTLRQFVAGPGCEYWATRMTRISDGKGRLDAYFLRVDTKNPYISLQYVMAKDKLISNERPSAMITRKTTPTSVYVGGTNGTFYMTTGDIGCPTGPTIIDGEFLYLGKSERSLGAVDVNGLGVFGSTYCWKFSGKLNLPDTTISINNVNHATRKENQLIMYNSYVESTRTNDYGTEVIVKLQEGETWKTKGNVKLVVVDVLKDKGNTPIAKGQYVLSAHGTKATPLKKLQIGDEISIDFTFKVNDVAQDLTHCVGADWYAQIITDGEVVTKDFWDELHPRTGFGANQEGNVYLFCVVDGRGQSVGVTTKVLGEIMKYNGAWNAVNWDGGGSSTMAINHFGQVNDPSDAGGERAVCDGMFAVANIPEEDNTIASILPHDTKFALPRYGIYTPKFYGYNKYGVMIDTDVQGVKLTCTADMGEVLNDSSFLASGTKSGTLYATLGDIKTSIEISFSESAAIAIRLDSVLVDNRKPYAIEITSQIGYNTVYIPSYVPTWTVEDESICVVSKEGEIKGLKNGRTVVKGTLGSFSDEIIVHVEIPATEELIWEDFAKEEDKATSTWNVSATAGFNPTFVPTPISERPTTGLQFTYKIGRKPYILLEKEAPLYGLPDSVRICFRTDADIESVALALRSNHQIESQFETHTFDSIATGKDQALTISIADMFEGTDRQNYPIWTKSLRFNIATTTTNGLHYIYWKGIVLYYDGVEVNYLDNTVMPTWQVYPNPVMDGYLQVHNAEAGAVLQLFDLQGRELLKQVLTADKAQIDIQAYPTGQYLLTIDHQTIKIIKQ